MLKKAWISVLIVGVLSLLMLFVATFSGSTVLDGNKQTFRRRVRWNVGETELVAGTVYEFEAEERAGHMIEGQTLLLEVYVEGPLAPEPLEAPPELDFDNAFFAGNIELFFGCRDVQVRRRGQSSAHTQHRCSGELVDTFELVVPEDGQYRLWVVNTGRNDADFLWVTLRSAALPTLPFLVLLTLSAFAVLLLVRRSPEALNRWVWATAIRPWRWTRKA